MATTQTYEGQTKLVAFNPIDRRWETVYPESELMPGETPIMLYWCNSAKRYFSIPD